MKFRLNTTVGGFFMICAAFICSCVAAPQKVTAEPDNAAYYELLGYDVEIVNETPRKLSGKYADFLYSYKSALSGNFDDAITDMQTLIGKDPDSIYLKNELGALYLQKGEYAKALAVLQSAAEHDPVDLETLFLLGSAYHGLNRIGEAINIYEKLITTPEGRNNQEVFFILAKLYLDSGNVADAKKCILQGAKAFPNNFGFYFILAEIYMQTKEYSKAEEAYKKTLRIEPYFFEARFALTNLYRETNRPNDVIAAYSDILAFDPENIPAMLGLTLAYRDANRHSAAHEIIGTLAVRSLSDTLVMSDIYGIYIDKGNYTDALYLLEGILSVVPHSTDLRYMAAICEQNQGNLEAALKHYALIDKYSRHYSSAVVQRALLLNQLGQTAEAMPVLLQAIDDMPDNDELYYITGLFFYEQKAYPEAVAFVENAVELSPDNIQYLISLGMFLEKIGAQDKAIEYMRHVLTLDPRSAPALNYIGYIYAEQGHNLDEAEKLILQAMEISPGDGYIVDSLGWVYYKQGKYSLALEYLLKAQAMQPSDPIISEHLADTYLKLNQREKAALFYEKALILDTEKERYDLVLKKLEAIKPNSTKPMETEIINEN